MSLGFEERPPAGEIASDLADRAPARAASARLPQGGDVTLPVGGAASAAAPRR